MLVSIFFLVPAGIISFGREIVVPWKTEVRLPCKYVGQPEVRLEWRYAGVVIHNQQK